MAPLILGLLNSGLRLVANAALVKGRDFIKEKTGVDLDLKQTSISAEDESKLRQFQAEHEEELLRLQLEDNKLGIEETKAYLADVQDARKNQAAIQMSEDAPWYAKAIQPVLAAFTVLATFTLFTLFVYWSGEFPMLGADGKQLFDADGKPLFTAGLVDTQKDILIYILGVLSGAVTQILSYYFGSSQGSKEKTKSLEAALQQKAVGEGK